MTYDTAAKLTNNLRMHIEELDNAGLENNPNKLKEEIINAREYVQSLKSNLAAYNDTARLEKVIGDVEHTVEMSEAHVNRLQRSASRNQYRESQSLNLNGSESRVRKAFGKTTERNPQEFSSFLQQESRRNNPLYLKS